MRILECNTKTLDMCQTFYGHLVVKCLSCWCFCFCLLTRLVQNEMINHTNVLKWDLIGTDGDVDIKIGRSYGVKIFLRVQ